MKHKWLSVFAVLMLMVIAGGCARTTPTATPEPLSGKLIFAGSTTVQPLAQVIGEAFNEKYPGITLEIGAGGSSVGIQAAQEGTVDIGMASRNLKPEEEASGDIVKHQVSVDVIAIAVHESNPVSDLSMEQLRAIYLGEITNWSEVGGPDSPVLVVVRDKNSGTRGAFDEIVLDKEDPTAEAEPAITASDVVALVRENDNAIGYVGIGHMEESGIKILTVGGVEASEKTAQDGSYAITRPLLLLTGPLSQELAQTFVDFALSDEGQQVVKEAGWVPMK